MFSVLRGKRRMWELSGLGSTHRFLVSYTLMYSLQMHIEHNYFFPIHFILCYWQTTNVEFPPIGFTVYK